MTWKLLHELCKTAIENGAVSDDNNIYLQKDAETTVKTSKMFYFLDDKYPMALSDLGVKTQRSLVQNSFGPLFRGRSELFQDRRTKMKNAVRFASAEVILSFLNDNVPVAVAVNMGRDPQLQDMDVGGAEGKEGKKQ